MSSNPSIPKLSAPQNELLVRLGTNFETGLTADEASTRREESGFNTLTPPINCPSWVCCLLPCIKHLSSMKAFRKLKPDDAEVLRGGRWVRYDAAGLVKGDIIRLEEGDVVPADGVVLAMQERSDMLVDVRGVTGEDKARNIIVLGHGEEEQSKIYYGGLVLHGAGTAVVTAVGSQTLLAQLIQEGKFPPKENVLRGRDLQGGEDDEDSGISLISRNVV